MRNALLFVLGLAMTAAPASANVSVETANGDWKGLPQLEQRGYDHLTEKMRAKLFEIAESKSCPSFVLSAGRLDFRMGFAAQYDSAGTLARLVLPSLGCPAAEGVAGGAILEMLQARDYAPTRKSSSGWYQGTLGFSFAALRAADPRAVDTGGQPGAVLAANQNEIVCEKVEVIGSRLASKRVCMSRSEWAARKRGDREEVERAQTQRGCKLDQDCGS